MFRLSKKTEYALLALQNLALREGELISVKELAQNLDISFEFLSKTMQLLMRKGLVQSHQGIKGGYVLSKPAKEIKLMEVINALKESISIVDCFANSKNTTDECSRGSHCTIKKHLYFIQNKIDDIFLNTTIYDIATIDFEAKLTESNSKSELNLGNKFIEIK